MLLQIPLDIPDVTIEKFNTPTKHGFVITVASKQKGTLCRHCGKFIDQFYGHGKEITLRHLPILEKPVWIKIKPKRYQCPYCDNGPTTTQECSWYIPKSPHTKKLFGNSMNNLYSGIFIKPWYCSEFKKAEEALSKQLK